MAGKSPAIVRTGGPSELGSDLPRMGPPAKGKPSPVRIEPRLDARQRPAAAPSVESLHADQVTATVVTWSSSAQSSLPDCSGASTSSDPMRIEAEAPPSTSQGVSSEYVAAPLRPPSEEANATPAANASYAEKAAMQSASLTGISWAELMAREGDTPRPDEREVIDPVEIFSTGQEVLASNRVLVPQGISEYYPVLFQAIDRAARDNGLIVCTDVAIAANTAQRQIWDVDAESRKLAVAKLEAGLRSAAIEVSAFVSALVKLPPGSLELSGRTNAGYCVAAWTAASHWWDVAGKVAPSRQTWWRELTVARETLRKALELCVGGAKPAQALMGAVCRLIRANVQNIVLGNRVREAATAAAQNKLREWAIHVTRNLIRSGPGQYVATLPKFLVRKEKPKEASKDKKKSSETPEKVVNVYRPIHPGVSSRGGLATDREATVAAVINSAVSRLPHRIPNWDPKGDASPDLWAWRIRSSLDRVYALLGPINRLFNRRRAELRASIFQARSAQTGPQGARAANAPQRAGIAAEEWRLARERYRAREDFAAEENQFFHAANHLAPEARSFQELHMSLADPEQLFKAIWAQTFEEVWSLRPSAEPEIGPNAELITAPLSSDEGDDGPDSEQ